MIVLAGALAVTGWVALLVAWLCTTRHPRTAAGAIAVVWSTMLARCFIQPDRWAVTIALILGAWAAWRWPMLHAIWKEGT